MTEVQVVIIGGKGTAINIAEQIEDAHQRFGYPMRVAGFAIDDPTLGREIAGFPVLAGVTSAWKALASQNLSFIFALYRPDVMPERLALLRSLGVPPERFANFIHPSAYVSPSVQLGVGNVVMSNATIQHGVRLGDFNIINSNVVIEHDAIFSDGVFAAACACIGARARIENATFLGLNATIREDVQVDGGSIIGMSACVLQNVSRDSLVYGVPARQAK